MVETFHAYPFGPLRAITRNLTYGHAGIYERIVDIVRQDAVVLGSACICDHSMSRQFAQSCAPRSPAVRDIIFFVKKSFAETNFKIAAQAPLGCKTRMFGYCSSTRALRYWLLPKPPTKKIPY